MNVLVYPNITYSRNLEADSYVILLGAILKHVAALRPDIRFTVLLPEPVESLVILPNVEYAEWPQPSYPNRMRCHFDTDRFLEILDWKNRNWDVVWSHLPEHTTQIRNVFYNCTDERPAIVGYCHWFEIPELHSMAADTLDLNLAGILSMDFCGLNSDWLKQIVLGHAAKRLSEDRLTELDNTLKPVRLGVDPAPDGEPLKFENRLLIWNHRPTAYTGFHKVIDVLDRLWARRQDFRLMVTLAPHGEPWADRPYAVANTVNGKDRDTYWATLRGAYLGLPRDNCQWSVAIQDGMSVGLPYILPRDFCYPEMVAPDYPLFYEDNLEMAIDQALSDPDVRGEASSRVLITATVTSWRRRVADAFIPMLDWASDQQPRVGQRSTRYAQVAELAGQGLGKAEIKKAMGWGIGIPWTPYRMRLADEAGLPSGGPPEG